MNLLLKGNLELDTDDIIYLYAAFRDSDLDKLERFADWPVDHLTSQVEKLAEDDRLAEKLKRFLRKMLRWPQMQQVNPYYVSDLSDVRTKIERLVHTEKVDKQRITKDYLADDRLGELINPEIEALKRPEQDYWLQLFELFSRAKAARPSGRYLKNASKIIELIGPETYLDRVNPWLQFVYALKEIETRRKVPYYGHYYYLHEYEFLHAQNHIFLKGLVWSLVRFYDDRTIINVARLAERSFWKVPYLGAVATGVGNACLYTLANVDDRAGINQLSRLKFLIVQKNAQKQIKKYLEEASVKLGISAEEIEEMSVPAFGLKDGQKVYVFENYRLRLTTSGTDQFSKVWLRPDGRTQKTIPAFVKESMEHKRLLRKAKDDVKQMKNYLKTQKDRLERSYLLNRTWDCRDFLKFYLHHGLIGIVAKKLIWEFERDGKYLPAFFSDGHWQDVDGQSIDWMAESSSVRLWHPIRSDSATVLSWRKRLEDLKISQPFRQVQREVYHLTDSELQSGAYTDRFANHLLKQHQFKALVAVKGWQYDLLGAFDDGRSNDTARKPLPGYQLETQFRISQAPSDETTNSARIFLRVLTGQLGFVKEENNPIDLREVPKIVLSEIMRDVNFFLAATDFIPFGK